MPIYFVVVLKCYNLLITGKVPDDLSRNYGNGRLRGMKKIIWILDVTITINTLPDC